jgi:hypothetical protein
MNQKVRNVWTYVREWVTANPKTLMYAAAVLLLVLLLSYCGHARAQPAPEAPFWNQARLSWTAPVTFTDGSPIGANPITYSVQRKLGTGSWAAVGPASITGSTWLDEGLVPGVYCYRAAATVLGRTSVWSNEACKTVVQPNPNAPGGVTVEDTGVVNQARVLWSAPSEFADGAPIGTAAITYSVQRKLGTGSWAAVGPASITDRVFLDSGLTAGVWCYRVQATVGGKQSVWSAEACKTVAQPDPNPPTLQVADSRVYDVRFQWGRAEFRVGREVGTIPVGSRCFDDFIVGADLYRVQRREVTFSRMPRSVLVVARCGMA